MKCATPTRLAAIFIVACFCQLATVVPGAAAAWLAPPLLTQFPEPSNAGSSADQLWTPNALALSPLNHHLYVSDTQNHRIAEYDAWGIFIRAFGWGVRNGDAEPQVCTAFTGCQAGITGSGPGQFGPAPENPNYTGPAGLAIDSTGDLYVMDLGNFRVQKFDSEGNFALAIGGEVNDTTGGNVCTKASGDTCVAGEIGTEPGEFSIENVTGVLTDYLAIGPDETLYVGDKNRIQTFGAGGDFQASIPLPKPGNPGALDVDPASGTIYFAYSQDLNNNSQPSQPNVYRLEPDGGQIEPPLVVSRPRGIAVAPGGEEIYVADQPTEGKAVRISVFDSDGSKLGEFGELELQHRMEAIATGIVGNDPSEFDVYAVDFRQKFGAGVAGISTYGAAPDPDLVGPPPVVPPTITEQYATGVETDSATLRVRINPKFWTDTTFQLEYGTGDCEASACAVAPGSPLVLSSRVANEPLLGPGIAIGNLEPGTTYHYRFVAESGGGGPVFGPDRTFTTAAFPLPPQPCPANEAYRTGASALLPDCRAYEMVSPVDKANSDIVNLLNSQNLPAALDQSAASGDRLTYSAARSFGAAEASPYSSQYLAVRDPALGWRGRGISPPRSIPVFAGLPSLDVQFKLFDEELCDGWFYQDSDYQLSPAAAAGYPSLYRRDLCGNEAYEPIPETAPLAAEPKAYFLQLQGTGGGHTVFRANDSLIEGVAPAGQAPKLYDYFEGGLSYVCVLPDGSPVSSGCSAGAGAGDVIPGNRDAKLDHAVSGDGSRIYWTAKAQSPGKLYLREEAASTIAVSKGAARFWGASASGSRVIFTEGSDLYAFEPEEDPDEGGGEIAGGVLGVAGMSDDARSVYFVSTEALAGAAPADHPNLYLYEAGGDFRFIATLAEGDVGENAIRSSIALRETGREGMTTPSGNALAFISANALTGQESADATSGKADSQVYLYAAEGDTLTCVSCNPTGARPVGKDIIKGSNEFWAAGQLPVAASHLYYPRVLSEDGKRIFFNSFDALVGRDTNGAMDVYQWEAEGKGSCEEADGCVSLISSGQSPTDSEFVDASADGDDVFFTTNSSLLPQDIGLVDIYDARAGGGFPAPPRPAAQCEGEACQGAYVPPDDPTPNSVSFNGAGNVKEKPPARSRCPKGRKRARKGGKARCVKPHKVKKRSAKKHRRNSKGNRAKANHRRSGS